MSRINLRGVTFDETTDWNAWLRDIAKGTAHRELRNDLDTPGAVSELAGQLPDALASRLADAALDILEYGTAAERDVVRGLPFARAKDAHNRLVGLVTTRAAELATARLLDPILYTLTEMTPSDQDVRALLVRELDANRGLRSSAIALLARIAPDWVAANVDRLRAEPTEMLEVFISTPLNVRAQMLDVLDKSDARVDALWQAVTDPKRLAPSTAAKFTAELTARPRFAARKP